MSYVAGLSSESATYRDAKGQQARFSFYISGGGGGTPPALVDQETVAEAVLAAIGGPSYVGQGGTNSMTNAYLQRATGVFNAIGNTNYGVATSAAYQEVVDKAVMVFEDVAGSIHRYEIPAPIGTIFEADLQTINPQAGAGTPPHLVVAFVSAMLTSVNGASVTSRSGIALNAFLGGYWRGRKAPKRVNIKSKTPQLTAQIPR